MLTLLLLLRDYHFRGSKTQWQVAVHKRPWALEVDPAEKD